MFDVAQLLAHQPLPMGLRVAIVGNSDALGLLAADSAAAAGLVVEMSVSLGANASAADFEAALDRAIDSDDVDAVVTVFIPPLNTTGDEVAAVLATVGDQSDKPIVSTFLATVGVPDLLRVPDLAASAGRGSVPSYPAPESAVRALARVVHYARWASRAPGKVPVFDDIDAPAARRLVTEYLGRATEPVELTDDQLRRLLGYYGLRLAPLHRVTCLREALAAGADFGWDVVLKATAEHLRQRPDLAHVRRDIDGVAAMTAAWNTLNSLIDDPSRAEFVVQPTAPPGISVSIGSLEDTLFGPIVSFGMAGTASELLGDIAYRIPPLTDSDAADLVRDVRAAPLFFGYRGSDGVDVPAIEEIVHRLAQLKDDLPDVQVLDLGLVLASADGAQVLRASGSLSAVQAGRSDVLTRRLTGPSSSEDTLIT
jgi:acyl-CoA synthetase (NDP forming)